MTLFKKTAGKCSVDRHFEQKYRDQTQTQYEENWPEETHQEENQPEEENQHWCINLGKIF